MTDQVPSKDLVARLRKEAQAGGHGDFATFLSQCADALERTAPEPMERLQRPFTPDEAKAYKAFVNEHFESPHCSTCACGLTPEPAAAHVDWLGLALELEAQAKRVESQTVERAMVAGARGLRLMGAAQPPGDHS
jgi:hypothetical protein